MTVTNPHAANARSDRRADEPGPRPAADGAGGQGWPGEPSRPEKFVPGQRIKEAVAPSGKENRSRAAVGDFVRTYVGLAHLKRLGGYLFSLMLAFLALALGAAFAVPDQRRLEGLVSSETSQLSFDVYVSVANLILLGVPVLVMLRRRYPMTVAYALGIAQLLFGFGPVMGFVIPHLMRVGDWRTIRRAGVLYGIGLGVGVPRDLRGQNAHTSMLRMLAVGPQESEVTVPTPVAMTVLLAGLSVVIPFALGWYLRTRDALRGSQREAELQRAVVTEQRAHSGQLSQELTRAQEREIIAREVHDVMGRRLSIISLYAGGLEADEQADPELRQAASLIKTTAQEAVADLRQLVMVMRDPGQVLAGSGKSIDDLDEMVAQATRSGQKCSAFIRIDDPARADRQVLYVVHRVVEELLTNAHKHAPEAHFYLQVRGNASQGISVEGRNRLAVGGRDSSRGDGGTGLTGIARRVQEIGGRFIAEVIEGEFVVHMWIPFALHPSS